MEIKRQLDVLDDIIYNNFHSPDIDQVLKEFDDLKTELQSLYDKKGKAAIFRSKCRWVEKGERPTKYFFNLEKRNYNQKTIAELRMEDETIINNETQILGAVESYFNNLYTSADSAIWHYIPAKIQTFVCNIVALKYRSFLHSNIHFLQFIIAHSQFDVHISNAIVVR